MDEAGTGSTAAPPKSPRRSRARSALLAAAVAMAAVTATTARFLIWPDTGVPARADAVVVLSGNADAARNTEGARLVDLGVAPVLAISDFWLPSVGTRRCAPPQVPSTVHVICFNPHPPTTQGEARMIGELARQYGWQSVVVVSSRPQATRARLRVSRCFPGRISMAPARIPRRQWPYSIVYEWAATAKALVVQRSC